MRTKPAGLFNRPSPHCLPSCWPMQIPIQPRPMFGTSVLPTELTLNSGRVEPVACCPS